MPNSLYDVMVQILTNNPAALQIAREHLADNAAFTRPLVEEPAETHTPSEWAPSFFATHPATAGK